MAAGDTRPHNPSSILRRSARALAGFALWTSLSLLAGLGGGAALWQGGAALPDDSTGFGRAAADLLYPHNAATPPLWTDGTTPSPVAPPAPRPVPRGALLGFLFLLAVPLLGVLARRVRAQRNPPGGEDRHDLPPPSLPKPGPPFDVF